MANHLCIPILEKMIYTILLKNHYLSYYSIGRKIFTQMRTNPKIVNVLGEVEGFMEVVYSFFKVILILIIDVLYNINLFIFFPVLIFQKII